MSEQQTAEECCPACGSVAWRRTLEEFKLLREQRDLYAAQAKINAQTVIRQAHEIRRLERDIARLTKPDEADEIVERFGL